MTVKTTIRSIRQAKGLTLKQVAKLLGTTAATVSRWEREPQRVTVPVLHNLAGVLNVSPQELLDSVRGRHNLKGSEVVMIRGLTPGHSNPFDAEYIRSISKRQPDDLAIVTVEGDAMEPALRGGDQALVDLRHTQLDRAGMFVFQQGEFAGIRRVLPQLGTTKALVKPENPSYGDGQLVDVNQVRALGRVIWVGKKV